MAAIVERILSPYPSIPLINYRAEPACYRLASTNTPAQSPKGKISLDSCSDLKKSPSKLSLSSSDAACATPTIRSRSASTSSITSFFEADTDANEDKKLSMNEIMNLWEPIAIQDIQNNEESVTTEEEVKITTQIESIAIKNERRESTNPLNLLADQDRPAISITASEDNLRNGRHLSKATANFIQAGSAQINPQTTANEKPIEIPADSGLGFSFVGGLESILGLWGALKGISEAKKKIKEIPPQYSNDLEKINSEKTKKTAQRDIKINTTVATRYSLSGMLSMLRIGNFSATLKQGATAALAKLGTAISFIAAPLAVFAAAITAYSIHRDRKSISKSNKINDAAKALQNTNTEKEISAILECIRSKQNIKTKKASLITNILSLGGYLTLGTGASLMLAYTVGGITSVASAAALVTPIGWGLAGLAALAGIGLGIYKYAKWREHKIEKQNALGDELLKISGAAAISRLLEMAQNPKPEVQNAAKSLLKKFMTEQEVNQLSTNDESFKFVARKLNIPVKIKKPASQTTQQINIRFSEV